MSAIGQVLACPRCGAMVEINAPPGWKPPAAAKQPAKPEAAKPEPAKPQSAQPPSAKPSPAKPAAAKPEEHSAIPAPVRPQPVSAAPAETFVAEPVLDDDPLVEMQRLATERERKQRKLLLVGGVLAGAALVVGGIWFALSKPDEIVENPVPDPATAPVSPAPSASSPVPKPQPTPGAVPSPSAAPSSSAVPVAPAPTATPMSSPAGTPSGTVVARVDPPMPAATPSATPSATGSAVGPMPPAVAAPPTVAVSPAEPLAPKPGFAPPSPAVTALLATKAPALDFAGATRRSALDIVGRLAGVGVQFDWDTLAPADLKPAEPVTVKLSDATYAESFAKLLEPIGARLQVAGDAVIVRGPVSDPRAKAVEYPIDDLAGSELPTTELYAGLVQLFVEPNSWDVRGGAGKLDALPGKLLVSQPAGVQRQTLVWLDRLRMARGKPTKGPTVGPALTLNSRLARAKPTLDKPVTMNFRPGVPLAEILAYLEKNCDALITLDVAALAEAGYDPNAAIGISADKTPLAQVLTALCEPREWAWRVVDERTFELTTRDALRRRTYVEFYDIAPLTAGIKPIVLIEEIKTQFADAGWADTGGEGNVRFDAASNRLIVLQHQDAQFRIERFLAQLSEESSKPGGAAPNAPPAANVPAAKPSEVVKPAAPIPAGTEPVSAP